MKNWSSVLGKVARRRNRIRLADISDQPVDLSGVEAFINCHALKQLTKDIVTKAKQRKHISTQHLRVVVLWLAGALLLSNHQRPGAIINATMAEYRAAKTTTVGRATYKTFVVANHKTSTTGRAKLTAGSAFCKFLDAYVNHLRPTLPDSPLLFPNKDGKPLDHLSRHVKNLGQKYGIQVPNATASRHAAATAVTKTGGEQEKSAVATLMSSG